MFVYLRRELASGGGERSESIGMISDSSSHLVEALLFFVALLGVLVVFRVDVSWPNAKHPYLRSPHGTI